MKHVIWLRPTLSVLCVVLLGACRVPFCHAQRVSTEDLRTMERILDRLLLGQAPSARTETRGLWLEGHGVLFSVPYTVTQYAVELDSARPPDRSKAYPDVAGLIEQVTQKRQTTIGRAVDSAKTALAVFFSRWAGAMNNLRPEHRVTVVVDFQLTGFYVPTMRRGRDAHSPTQTRRLIASARFADILSMRRGGGSPALAVRALRFIEEKGEGPVDSELAILADVVDSYLRSSLGSTLYGGPTRALRVPELGVVLMCGYRVPTHSAVTGLDETYRKMMESQAKAMEMQKQLEEVGRALRALGLAQRETELRLPASSDTAGADTAQEAKRSRQERQRAAQEKLAREARLAKVENDLVALLGRYCPALSFLSDQEAVLVLLEVGAYSDPQATRLQIGVKMRDVRRLAREEITPQQFRALATVTRE
ncbi:MAG: capsid morphogenesis B protein [candidate division KSB1 bacterium]|nr:capsid morphogenesis B protein [candidate division KSB1 bacterium]MDZ7412902.1 capsid morphogenesis B protein [candidate division KSB1 bacterium]